MSERGPNYLVFIPVILIGLVVSAFAFKAGQDFVAKRNGIDPNSLPSARAGQDVPALVLEDLPGKQNFTSDDLIGGGYKLVNFWASWCAPCRVEHPNLQDLSNSGIPVYGVNYKNEQADGLRFLEELGDPYRAVGADPNGRNGLDWGVIALPETFIVDNDGKVVLRHAGPLTDAVIENIVLPALDN